MVYKKTYDFLIVGAGPFGSVCARELTDAGYKVLVIDKRDHIAGNCYTKEINGIHVHTYGAHIFHTNDKDTWDWVNKYAKFNSYRHKVVANYKGEIYSLPFNMFTFNKIWGIVSPDQVVEKIEEQSSLISTPKNLEEHSIKMIGKEVYEKLIKGYTAKQWGRDPVELPISIIKRIPIRYTYDNDYFSDTYQGIPIGGYTKMFENILSGIEIRLSEDFFNKRDLYEKTCSKIIYTGPIDQFFNYSDGRLEYRSLGFKTESRHDENYQGCSVMNYTDIDTPYTRIIEHKHFDNQDQSGTIITKEYPLEYNQNNEPFYPINDEKNNNIYSLYKRKAESLNNYYFGGRLGRYQYYDMHQVIASALVLVKKLKSN
jgi:UDP-galactopyranose mutase